MSPSSKGLQIVLKFSANGAQIQGGCANGEQANELTCE